MILQIANNKIVGIDCIGYQEQGISYPIEQVEVSEEIYNDYLVNPDKYIYLNGEVVIDSIYEERKAKEEQYRINNLTMTALDFIGVLQSLGLTLEQINAYLEANLTLKMQLTYCQNVYCGVVRQLVPLTVEDVTITDDMVVKAFKLKNGESEGYND